MPKINKISSNVAFIYLFLKYLTLIQRDHSQQHPVVPKLCFTGRNAQQSRWGLSCSKVSLRTNSLSIHIDFFSRSTQQVIFTCKVETLSTLLNLFLSHLLLRRCYAEKIIQALHLQKPQESPKLSLLLSTAKASRTSGEPEHQLHTDHPPPIDTMDTPHRLQHTTPHSQRSP